MKTVPIKAMKLSAEARLPKYSYDGEFGDLAADLYSIETRQLSRGEIATIRTGIAIQLPPGFGAVVADRSGLALRGLTTLAGVIDPGYRGEIKIVVAYLGSEPLTIQSGDRIAQLRIVERIEGVFEEVEQLEKSARDNKGFGSSGQ
jgi:dUTP pyrophosphatase